jgi:hypothetical protein
MIHADISIKIFSPCDDVAGLRQILLHLSAVPSSTLSPRIHAILPLRRRTFIDPSGAGIRFDSRLQRSQHVSNVFVLPRNHEHRDVRPELR